MAQNKPNLFILGAGKSGTSSLYHHLREHPKVFMCPEKEPTFYCSSEQQWISCKAQYLKLFDKVSDELIIGEASHAYLSDTESPGILHEQYQHAKFIIILRNPADRAYSLYHHMCRHGREYAATFEQALELENLRSNSEHLRKNSPTLFNNFMYFKSGLYAEQIERYFSFFHKKQFFITTLDELKTSPELLMARIFRFLNVRDSFKPQFSIKNEGRVTARLPVVHYFLKTVVKPYRIRGGVKVSWYIRKTIGFKKIPPMKDATRNHLQHRYKEDLERLYELTGISFHMDVADLRR